MANSKATGTFIAECRKEKGLTQKALGEKLNFITLSGNAIVPFAHCCIPLGCLCFARRSEEHTSELSHT